MPITINIYYTGKNNNARKFAQEMHEKGIVERIRQSPGNIKYELNSELPISSHAKSTGQTNKKDYTNSSQQTC